MKGMPLTPKQIKALRAKKPHLPAIWDLPQVRMHLRGVFKMSWKDFKQHFFMGGCKDQCLTILAFGELPRFLRWVAVPLGALALVKGAWGYVLVSALIFVLMTLVARFASATYWTLDALRTEHMTPKVMEAMLNSFMKKFGASHMSTDKDGTMTFMGKLPKGLVEKEEDPIERILRESAEMTRKAKKDPPVS